MYIAHRMHLCASATHIYISHIIHNESIHNCHAQWDRIWTERTTRNKKQWVNYLLPWHLLAQRVANPALDFRHHVSNVIYAAYWRGSASSASRMELWKYLQRKWEVGMLKCALKMLIWRVYVAVPTAVSLDCVAAVRLCIRELSPPQYANGLEIEALAISFCFFRSVPSCCCPMCWIGQTVHDRRVTIFWIANEIMARQWEK